MRCFVKNALFVMIGAVFSKLMFVKEKNIVKMGLKGFTSGYQRGKRVVLLIKMVLFALFAVL